MAVFHPLFILKRQQLNCLRRFSSFLQGVVLDIGCGTRPFRELINARRYVGIDLAAGVLPDVRSGCLALPFKDASFDAVLCTEVLEHLTDPALCLAEIRRVLRKDGYAYISVPQTWCLHYPPHDYWRFTSYGLALLVERSGLHLVGLRRIGGVFSLVGVRLADVAWTGLAGLFGFLGRKNAERLAAVFCLPWSLLFYAAALAGDGIDQRDALGWAALVRK